MAMFECPGCKRIVDESTKKCFNCGYNIKKYVKDMQKCRGTKDIGSGTMSLSSVYKNEKSAAINLPKLDFLSGNKPKKDDSDSLFESPSLNKTNTQKPSSGTGRGPAVAKSKSAEPEPLFDSPLLNAQAKAIAQGNDVSSVSVTEAQNPYQANGGVTTSSVAPVQPQAAPAYNIPEPTVSVPAPDSTGAIDASQLAVPELGIYGTVPKQAPVINQAPVSQNVTNSTLSSNGYGANQSSMADNPMLSSVAAQPVAPVEKKEPRRIIQPTKPEEKPLFESPLLNMEAKRIAQGTELPANQRPRKVDETANVGSSIFGDGSSSTQGNINTNPSSIFSTYGKTGESDGLPPYAAKTQPVSNTYGTNPLLSGGASTTVETNPFVSANSPLNAPNPLLSGGSNSGSPLNAPNPLLGPNGQS